MQGVRYSQVGHCFCATCVAILCLTWAPRASVAEDALYRAWAEGPPERRALLGASRQHLRQVRERAYAARPAPAWAEDADVRWLLSHRTPAVLVIERELEMKPEGQYLEAITHMACALGHRRLTRKVADLYAMAELHATRVRVLRMMAESRDRHCVAFLQQYLQDASRNTPEDLICEAARGLGLTRREEFLPDLQRAYRLVRSRRAQLRVAAARYLCGETEMLQPLLEVIRERRPGNELRTWALQFVCKHPGPPAVPLLAELATEAPEKQEADLALDALARVTGYRTRQNVYPEETDADSPRGEDDAQERRALVHDMLAWHGEHPEATLEPWTRKSRREALAQSKKGPPH